MRNGDHEDHQAKTILLPREDVVQYLDSELRPPMETKSHLLTILRPSRMMKETHLREVQETLLQVHPP
jgi:hypothetical protein